MGLLAFIIILCGLAWKPIDKKFFYPDRLKEVNKTRKEYGVDEL